MTLESLTLPGGAILDEYILTAQPAFPTFVFNHVPKTGGTAVIRSLLKATDGTHLRTPIKGETDGRKIIDGQPGYTVYSSHLAYRKVNKAPGEYWIATWRNPISMFFSAWDFFHRRPHLTATDPLYVRQVRAIMDAESFEAYLDQCESGKLIPFPIGWMPDLDAFDLVISADNMYPALRVLEEETGVNIPSVPVDNVSDPLVDRDKYRQRVSRFLWPWIERMAL